MDNNILRQKIVFAKSQLIDNKIRLETWKKLQLTLQDSFFIELFNFERKIIEQCSNIAPSMPPQFFAKDELELYSWNIDRYSNNIIEIKEKLIDYKITLLKSCENSSYLIKQKIDLFIQRLGLTIEEYKKYIYYYQFALDFVKEANLYDDEAYQKVNNLVMDYVSNCKVPIFGGLDDDEEKENYIKKYCNDCKSMVTVFLFQPPLVTNEDNIKYFIINCYFSKMWNPNKFVIDFCNKLNKALLNG